MITVKKVKAKMFEPKHDEYIFTQLTKKEHGERAVLLAVYKPTPEVHDLRNHFNVERLVHRDPKQYPYPATYVESYKITEKVRL
jgi:hypothetical protein